MRQLSLCILSAAGVMFAGQVSAESDLTELTFEDLLAVEVTSVARRPQRASETAAAVYVVTQDQIRRSGASTLAEAVSLAPGMQTADLANGAAAVSSRGFNGRFSNKLLVLVDGRTVYQGAVSAVPWETLAPLLADIERIEVVRGPAAALWGPNAVNGVINVVSKHALDSQGLLTSVQADTEEGVVAGVRHGLRAGRTGSVRAYATFRRADSGADVIRDQFSGVQAGFRYDVEPNARDAVTIQGDVFTNEAEVERAPLALPGFGPPPGFGRPTGPMFEQVDNDGFNLITRFTRDLGDKGGFTVQAALDRSERRDPYIETSNTEYSLDASRHQPLFGGDTVWGLNLRRTDNELVGFGPLHFIPKARTETWAGAYAQHEAGFLGDQLRLTGGLRLDQNSLTGLEIQPSLRGLWLDDRWSAWAAVSRGVRTPARYHTDLRLMLGPINVAGTDFNLKSEEVVAAEAGWRARLSDSVQVDLAAYHARYEKLLTLTAPAPGAAPVFRNAAEAEVTGLEAVVAMEPHPRWRLELIGSVSEVDASPGSARAVSAGPTLAGPLATPEHQVAVWSSFDLTDALEFDVRLARSGAYLDGGVDARNELDVRLAWRPLPRLELYVQGRDLLTDGDTDSVEQLGPAPVVVRSRARLVVGVTARL